VAVVSDFYEEPEQVANAVRQLRQRGNDVVVFNVLDPAELDFPYDEAMTIVDVESGDRLPVVPETLKDEYRGLIAKHVEDVRRRMIGHGFDYVRLDTSVPLDHALSRYLAARERMRSAR
jgi:hypothetical protein